MKKTTILLTFILFSGFVNAQNNATIEETVDFLKSKLTKEYGNFSLTVSFDKTKCMLILKDKDTGDFPTEGTTYIPLGKIDPSMIEIFQPKGSDRIKLNIYMINKEKLIKIVRTDKWVGENAVFYEDMKQFDFDLLSLQNDIPERVKKAFIHAHKLCGGKQEKF